MIELYDIKTKIDMGKTKADSDRPTLLIAGRDSIRKELLDGFSTLNINIVFLSKNMDIYEKLFCNADFILILGEDGERFLSDAWQNGVIPIVASGAPRVANYNPIQESGNSFTFQNEEMFDIFAAMVRALETFKFPHDWKHLISQAQRGERV